MREPTLDLVDPTRNSISHPDLGDTRDDPSPRTIAWLARLGALFLQEDPPPPAAIELARQSFVLRNLDGDLAALVEDSESDDPAAVVRSVAVRGTGTAPETRQLTFLSRRDQRRRVAHRRTGGVVRSRAAG